MAELWRVGKAEVGVGEWVVPERRNKYRKRLLEQQLPLILLVYLLLGWGKQELLMILFLELFSVWLERVALLFGYEECLARLIFLQKGFVPRCTSMLN